MTEIPWLSLTLFIPAAGAVLLALIPKDADKTVRAVSLFVSLLALGASFGVLARFDAASGDFQMVERIQWVPSSGAAYLLGVDGISLWMVLLTTFLTPLALIASASITKKVKAFHMVVLLLETGMLGAFLAIDLLLFYIFWEGMLIPMYLLIGIWGSSRRVYAAVKFFLYTLAGSLLMLAGVIALYFVGGETFDLQALIANGVPRHLQGWLFAAFFISFAIKVPIFPLHTWLPDAHTEAPTAGSVFLAGVLLKMGAYGFLRFSIPLFPDASHQFAPWLAALGAIGIVYGGLVAVVQRDIKRLVAYSSVSHLGFVVLGIAASTSISTSGAVLQMLNHGLSTGALFLMVGMLYERAHTREIASFGGINRVMPIFGGVFLMVALSSMGLPGLNGFIGEFLILNGSFGVFRAATIAATAGVVIAAVYLLWAYERMFTGEINLPHADRSRVWKDLRVKEVLVLAPILALIVWIGVYPKPFLSRIEPSVERLVEMRTDTPAVAER